VLGAVLVASVLTGPAAASAATSTREARMVAAINHTRVAHGLAPLRPVASLMRYARSHTRAMAARGYLYHTSNFSVICCWSVVAENIGYGQTVAGLHRAFMASPPHRANLLNGRLRQVGIGIVVRGDAIWVTEVFRRPR